MLCTFDKSGFYFNLRSDNHQRKACMHTKIQVMTEARNQLKSLYPEYFKTEVDQLILKEGDIVFFKKARTWDVLIYPTGSRVEAHHLRFDRNLKLVYAPTKRVLARSVKRAKLLDTVFAAYREALRDVEK